LNAAAYIRVSSRSQDLATQRHAIEAAAKARGDEITEWFAEKRSAKRLDRPELARLCDRARRGEVARLYVFRLDRLSRTGIRDTLSVLDDLRRGGAHVVTIADGFDLEGPASDVVVAVLGWAAQMERQALGERISAARARVEARGGKWGRPARVPETTVRRIRELAGKRSIREISAALKVPRSTVAAVVSEKGAYKLVPKRAAKRPKRKN